jgi:hypothetical protein
MAVRVTGMLRASSLALMGARAPEVGRGDEHDQWRTCHHLFERRRSRQSIHKKCIEVPICGRAQRLADLHHEFYLMTDDLDLEMAALKRAGARCEAVTQQNWGHMTRIKLPGDGTLGLYQPRHERP